MMNRTSSLRRAASVGRKAASVFCALVLVVGLCPLPSTQVAYADEDASANADADLEALLEAGSYAEGEAVVIVANDADASESSAELLGIFASESDQLLASAESLMDLDAETVSGAAQDCVDPSDTDTNAEIATLLDDESSALAQAADEGGSIVLVTSDTLSTRELLYTLSENPRVVSVEPNYTFSFEAEELAETEALATDGVTADAAAAAVTEDAAAATATEDAAAATATDEATSAAATTAETAGTSSEASDTFQSGETDASDAELTSDAASSASSASDDATATLSDTSGETLDLTDRQWAYQNVESGAMKNPAGETQRSYGFDLGIEGWNQYDEDGNPVANATGVVAVIDSGFDVENPDLANVMIQNAKTYAKDTKYASTSGDHGYNAADDSGDLTDNYGHGTHCAGIVGAEWNGTGTSGAASGIEIIGVKAGDHGLSTARAVAGYDYLSALMDNGLKLVSVNNSWGSSSYVGATLSIAAYQLGLKGAITIFASGNDGYDDDAQVCVPFVLEDNPYVVTVNASNYNGERAPFCCWGMNTTDVYAPGMNILSTKSQNAEEGYSGASDPSPLVKETFEGTTDANPLTSGDVIVADLSSFTMAGAGNSGTATVPTSESELKAAALSTEYVQWVSDATMDATSDETAEAGATSGSLRIDLQALAQAGRGAVYVSGDEEPVESILQFSVFVKMSKSQVENIQYLSASYRQSDYFNGGFYFAPLQVTSDTSTDTRTGSFTLDGYLQDDTWGETGVTYNVDEGCEIPYVTTSDPDMVYVPFTFAIPQNHEAGVFSHYQYVDMLCFGQTDTYWTYMTGTSMATPAVAGTAAVCAKLQQDQGTLHFIADDGQDAASASALERADMLRGSTIPVAYEEDYPVSQCGQVNISSQNLCQTPVLHNYAQETDTSTLTLTGTYFGDSAGTVTLDGIEATVQSWTASEIRVQIPESVAAGSVLLKVTASNGKMCKRKIAWSTGAIAEFPNELASISSALTDATTYYAQNFGVQRASMCTCNGKIYALTMTTEGGCPRALCAYDPASDSWTTVVELEDNYEWICPSVVALDGKVYCYVTKFNYSEFSHILFVYDPEGDPDEQLTNPTYLDTSALDDLERICPTLATAQGKLLLCGGFDASYQTPTENTINELSIDESGKVTFKTKGDLAVGAMALQAVEHNGSVYLAGGSVLNDEGTEFVSASLLQRLDYDETQDVWVATDLTSSLPAIDQSTYSDCPGNLFGLTAIREGIIVSGANVLDANGTRVAQDSYFLQDGRTDFVPLSYNGVTYSASFSALFGSVSCALDGVVYTMGISLYGDEDSHLIFRSAQVTDCIKIPRPQAIKGLVYNGTEQTGVAAGEGYTVTNGSATDAGIYTATVVLEPGYYWEDGSYDTAEVEFKIAPASLEDGAVVGAIADQIWTGSAIEPAITVTYGDLVLVEGVDFEVSYANNVEVGTATVTVTGIGNFAGTLSATFDIVAAQPVENEYKIIEGAGQTIDVSKVSSAIFRSDAPFAKFSKLVVDGADVDAKYYDVSEGSTVVTLNKAFLSTLANGEHSLSVVATDGHADTTFTITGQGSGNNTSAKTGDTALPLLPAGLAFMGAVAAAYALRRSKEC